MKKMFEFYLWVVLLVINFGYMSMSLIAETIHLALSGFSAFNSSEKVSDLSLAIEIYSASAYGVGMFLILVGWLILRKNKILANEK